MLLRFLTTDYFLKLTFLVSNNKSFVQRSQIKILKISYGFYPHNLLSMALQWPVQFVFVTNGIVGLFKWILGPTGCYIYALWITKQYCYVFVKLVLQKSA